MQLNEYMVSTDREQMDLDLIYSNLARSYWAKDIPKETVARSMEHSLCIGVFDRDHSQVAFGRVITDFATFAYIGDVFVIEACRGKGIGKLIMRSIMELSELQGLRRMILATRDAHGLYVQFGFSELANPTQLMEIRDSEIYSTRD
ncbi:MAG: GNAT superfamily N-acetyltransferase [Planctomycetota bacterium]|jgi:GNAT superfamily N-acetyltransferase